MHLEELLARDAQDPLASVRQRFLLPDGLIYLDGNSLGALPSVAPSLLAHTIAHEWGERLIRSWNEAGWIDLPQRLGARIAPLIGAQPDEVIVADSTSVNLFKVLSAALRLNPHRRVILSEQDNFPTDLYIVQGLIALSGERYTLRLVTADALEHALDEDVALLLLTHVNYRTGAMHDMARLTRLAHARGALTIWDLAHSAGALPLALDADAVDFAVGCGYKYLNGGPGAPAFLFVAQRWQADFRQPLTGWMGHAQPFAFAPDYQPTPGVAQALCGTPPILALRALEAGLATFDGVDMHLVREKSLALTDLFITLVESLCADFALELITPREPQRRGSQVSFRHPQAHAVVQALIARGVIGDFRAPDVMRFGFAPLYVRYRDVWDAAHALADVLRSRAWQDPRFQRRAKVT